MAFIKKKEAPVVTVEEPKKTSTVKYAEFQMSIGPNSYTGLGSSERFIMNVDAAGIVIEDLKNPRTPLTIHVPFSNVKWWR